MSLPWKIYFFHSLSLSLAKIITWTANLYIALNSRSGAQQRSVYTNFLK